MGRGYGYMGYRALRWYGYGAANRVYTALARLSWISDRFSQHSWPRGITIVSQQGSHFHAWIFDGRSIATLTTHRLEATILHPRIH